jgi:hypothetical protein
VTHEATLEGQPLTSHPPCRPIRPLDMDEEETDGVKSPIKRLGSTRKLLVFNSESSTTIVIKFIRARGWAEVEAPRRVASASGPRAALSLSPVREAPRHVRALLIPVERSVRPARGGGAARGYWRRLSRTGQGRAGQGIIPRGQELPDSCFVLRPLTGAAKVRAPSRTSGSAAPRPLSGRNVPGARREGVPPRTWWKPCRINKGRISWRVTQALGLSSAVARRRPLGILGTYSGGPGGRDATGVRLARQGQRASASRWRANLPAADKATWSRAPVECRSSLLFSRLDAPLGLR